MRCMSLPSLKSLAASNIPFWFLAKYTYTHKIN
uniref:Uncharacterized protein n=1 Tax=Arundo donax TaxID=35708 RepID=A0A0A9C178_ARUDO